MRSAIEMKLALTASAVGVMLTLGLSDSAKAGMFDQRYICRGQWERQIAKKGVSNHSVEPNVGAADMAINLARLLPFGKYNEMTVATTEGSNDYLPYKDKLNAVFFERKMTGPTQEIQIIEASFDEATFVVTVHKTWYIDSNSVPYRREFFSGICEAN